MSFLNLSTYSLVIEYSGIDDREWKAKEIKGGTEVVMKPGDWLWIPAGEPHQHKTSTKARLVIIKVPKV
jgi:uncharacterized RmlC-like cupin family protein